MRRCGGNVAGLAEIGGRKRMLFGSVIALILLPMAIALAEILSSVYYGLRGEYDHSLRIVPEYGSPYVYTTVHTSSGRINNFGMRRTEDIAEVPEGETVRMLSYGDSIGFGHSVGDEEHFPYLLEKFLNERGPRRYEVLNMARGCSPSLYALHLKLDIVRFKPQIVVVEVEMSNDVSDEALITYSGLDRHNLPRSVNGSRYLMTWSSKLMSTLPLGGPLLERSIIYNVLIRTYGNFRDVFEPNPVFSRASDEYYYHIGYDKYYLTKERLSGAFDRMFDTIRAMRIFCEERGVEFLLMIMPSRFVYSAGRYRSGSVRMIERAEAKARQLHIPCISLRQAFQENGGADLFIDIVHPKAEGYRVVADELYKYFTSSPESQLSNICSHGL